ncbi:MAG: AtpZ/AtpI family protein [Chloroflexi bacterium]|nr:AtpZ/AtpI family protein [Chloroflexota bacterium]
MRKWAAALRLLGIGWYIVFCLIAGLAVGLWLDKALGTTPLLTLTCFFLGLVAAFVGLYRMLFPLATRDSNENEKEDN